MAGLLVTVNVPQAIVAELRTRPGTRRAWIVVAARVLTISSSRALMCICHSNKAHRKGYDQPHRPPTSLAVESNGNLDVHCHPGDPDETRPPPEDCVSGEEENHGSRKYDDRHSGIHFVGVQKVDGGVGAGTSGSQSLHVGCSMLMVISEDEGNGSVTKGNCTIDSLTSCLVAGGGRLHMWDQA